MIDVFIPIVHVVASVVDVVGGMRTRAQVGRVGVGDVAAKMYVTVNVGVETLSGSVV